MTTVLKTVKAWLLGYYKFTVEQDGNSKVFFLYHRASNYCNSISGNVGFYGFHIWKDKRGFFVRALFPPIQRQTWVLTNKK